MHPQRERFHNRFQYMIVESVCEDEEVLLLNYMNKIG
jgi:hypothetical protein